MAPKELERVLWQALGQARAAQAGEQARSGAAVRADGVAGAWAEQRKLSSREREIGLLVAEGYSSAEIAQALFISRRTVEKHRVNLMAKLGVSNAAALTRELLHLGWAEGWNPRQAAA